MSNNSTPAIESFQVIALRLGLTCEDLLIKVGAVEGVLPHQPHRDKVAAILRSTEQLNRSELVQLVTALAERLE